VWSVSDSGTAGAFRLNRADSGPQVLPPAIFALVEDWRRSQAGELAGRRAVVLGVRRLSEICRRSRLLLIRLRARTRWQEKRRKDAMKFSGALGTIGLHPRPAPSSSYDTHRGPTNC
jgi:hypothetical protein